MSILNIRSTTLAAVLFAATSVTAHAEDQVAPDVADMMTRICTANTALVQNGQADPQLSAAYKAENQSYAERLKASGFRFEPCATL